MHFGAEGMTRAFLCVGPLSVGDEGLIENSLNDLPPNDLRDLGFQGDAKSDACPGLTELASRIDSGLADVVEAWPGLLTRRCASQVCVVFVPHIGTKVA